MIAALAAQDLRDERAKKVVIAVSQSVIASSFDTSEAFVLPPRGPVVHWAPGHKLIETVNILDRLRTFLMRPLAVSKINPERILVCTHAALVAYHNEYHGEGAVKKGRDPNDWSDYQDLAVNIDEAHHSCAPGEASEDDLRDAEECNGLGTFVSDWLERQPGPLTLTTATWFRQIRIAIVPPEHYHRFSRYTHSIVDHLAGMEHLRQVEIRFLIGAPEECLKQLQQEDRHANTLVYLRPVAPGRDKLDELRQYQECLGLTEADCVDLVTPAGRRHRKDALTASIRSGQRNLTAPRLANWLFALMLGREGFDFPALQRSAVMGPRSSMQTVMQMLGRLLRDHPQKTKVQFNIVLPISDLDMQSGPLIHAYLKVMLVTLALGVILNPPKFERAEDAKAFDTLTEHGPDALADQLAAIASSLPDDPIDDAAGS